jgi:hypothetical protein
MNPLPEEDILEAPTFTSVEDGKSGVEVEGQFYDDETVDNPQLSEVLTFYDCADLLPYTSHIMWLSSVKESTGSLAFFNLEWFDIRCLTILQDEVNKKQSKQMKDSEAKTRQTMGPS